MGDQYSPFANARSGAKAVESSFINSVYLWMTLGLALTGAVALFTAGNEFLLGLIYGNPITIVVLILAELGLVMFLSARVQTLRPSTATGLYILYAAINGLTLSVIFLVYTRANIATAFFVTAGTFGAMSIYGFITKRDLTSMGSLAVMGLIGVLIASLVNMFLRSEGLYWIITYVAVAVFIGLTAYDTQRIKMMAYEGFENEGQQNKFAILGALRLYLDFVNLFLLFLRIFGRRR